MTSVVTDLQQTILDNIAHLNESENFSPVFERETIMAFCEIESSFNPYAYRFEPKKEEASWGLMQILLSTARDRGFNGEAPELYRIDTGLQFGMRQLAWIREYLGKHGGNLPVDDVAIAAAYNAGVGNFLHGYVPRIYVAKFQQSKSKWVTALA